MVQQVAALAALLACSLAQLEYASQLRLGVRVERDRAGRARAATRLRVTTWEDGSIAGPERAGARAAVETAVRYWRARLRPVRPGGLVRLDRGCAGPGAEPGPGCPPERGCAAVTRCGEVEVPAAHLAACRTCSSPDNCTQTGPAGRGLRADLVLYMSSVESAACKDGATLAHASHCQQEAGTDRPVAGHVNLCPGPLLKADLAHLADTVKHELLHILGFSVQLFPFYRDGRGRARTVRDKAGRPRHRHPRYLLYLADPATVRRVERTGWEVAGGTISRMVTLLATPAVRREVGRHFGCDGAEGGELEDQGDPGTAFTHWEKRVFGEEGMTGNHQQLNFAGRLWRERTPFSRITLAALQDSGWYRVRLGRADQFSWGAGAGCQYLNTSCTAWIRSQPSPAPYCTQPTPVRRQSPPPCFRYPQAWTLFPRHEKASI